MAYDQQTQSVLDQLKALGYTQEGIDTTNTDGGTGKFIFSKQGIGQKVYIPFSEDALGNIRGNVEGINMTALKEGRNWVSTSSPEFLDAMRQLKDAGWQGGGSDNPRNISNPFGSGQVVGMDLVLMSDEGQRVHIPSFESRIKGKPGETYVDLDAINPAGLSQMRDQGFAERALRTADLSMLSPEDMARVTRFYDNPLQTKTERGQQYAKTGIWPGATITPPGPVPTTQLQALGPTPTPTTPTQSLQNQSIPTPFLQALSSEPTLAQKLAKIQSAGTSASAGLQGGVQPINTGKNIGY